MTIRPTSTSATSPVGPVSADAAESGTAAAAGAPGARASAPAGTGDRVELSAAARAQADASGETGRPGIETARHALRSEDALSPGRLHELREKARSGHYDSPAAIDRMAEAAARDLSPPTDIE